MSYDRIRLYDAGRLHDTDLPDWYREAERLCETVHVDFHRAFDRVLGCEHTLLTEEGLPGGALEIRFWPSEIHGFFVLIETPLSFVEHVIVPNPADWLPFLSRHLAPLIGVANQSSLIALHGRIGNAFIAGRATARAATSIARRARAGSISTTTAIVAGPSKPARP